MGGIGFYLQQVVPPLPIPPPLIHLTVYDRVICSLFAMVKESFSDFLLRVTVSILFLSCVREYPTDGLLMYGHSFFAWLFAPPTSRSVPPTRQRWASPTGIRIGKR